MDKEEKILERLRSKSFSQVVNNLQEFPLTADSLSFVSRVLHICLDSLTEISSSSSIKSLDGLQSVIKGCYNLCKRGATNDNEIISAVEKYLYHFITRLIELGKFSHSKEISTLLLDSLQRAINGIKEVNCLPKGKVIIMKNTYLLFWNTALKITVSEKQSEVASFHYRLEALRYLSMYTEDIVKFIDQALKAIHKYESCDSGAEINEILNFHEVLHSLIKSNLRTRSKSLKEFELVSLFHWLVDYLSFLQKTDSNKQIDKILVSFEKDILKHKLVPDNELKRMCATSLELIGTFSQLSLKEREFKSKILETNIPKYYSSLEKSVASGSSMKNSILPVTYFVLRTCKIFLFGKKTSIIANLEFIDEMIMFPIIRLMRTLMKCTEEQNYINTKYCSKESCHQIVTSVWKELLILLLQSIELFKENEEHIKCLIHHAEVTAKDSITTLDSLLLESSEIYLNLSTLGTNIWNIGVVCYNKSLFKYATPFFKMFCDHITKWCLSDANQKKSRLKQMNLWKKYELLITSQRKSGQFREAAHSVVAGIDVYSDFLPSFTEAWVKIKRDAQLQGNYHLQNWTIKKAFNDLYPDRDNLKEVIFDFLHLELKAFKSQRFDMKECRYAIIKDMMVSAQTKIQKAIAFLELAQLQWIEVFDTEHSAVNCCRQAICLLEDEMSQMQHKSKFPFKAQLAASYFWMYLCELQIFQEHSQFEANKDEVVPLETQLVGEDDNEEELDIKCDVTPTFYHITIDTELESFHYLEKAIVLWSEINYNAEFPIDRETLENLKAVAEIFSVARQIEQEIEVWQLTRKATENTSLLEDYILSTSRLVELFCKTHMIQEAWHLLTSCEDLVNKGKSGLGEDNVAIIRYSLVYAEVCYHNLEVSKGLSILQNLWNSNLVLKKSRTYYILAAELKKISSLYSLISDSSLKPWGIATPTELMTEALRYYHSLAKSLSDSSQSPTKVDLPGYSHQVVAGLLDTTLMASQMYSDIGAIREARCYLKEQLKLAQLLGLAHRSAELLLLLAELDTVCTEVGDCQVKLQGITFILQSGINFKWEMKDRMNQITADSKTGNNLTDLNQKAGEPLKPSQNVKNIYDDDNYNENATQCSLKNTVDLQFTMTKGFSVCDYYIEIPEFINHEVNCNCKKCKDLILLEIAMKLLLLHATCLEIESKMDESIRILCFVLNRCDAASNSAIRELDCLENKAQFTKSRILINKELLVCKLFLKLSTILFGLRKFRSSLSKVEEALNIFVKLNSSLQMQQFILHSYLLKQKSICILQLMAIQKNMIPLVLLQEKWKFVQCTSEEDPVAKITQNLQELTFNCDSDVKTPVKLSGTINSDILNSSTENIFNHKSNLSKNDYVSPSVKSKSKGVQKLSYKTQVCNAPKRKKNVSSRMPYSVLRKRALDEFDSDSEPGTEQKFSTSSSNSSLSCIPDTPPESHKKASIKLKDFASKKTAANNQISLRSIGRSKKPLEPTLKSKEIKTNITLKKKGRKVNSCSNKNNNSDKNNTSTVSLKVMDPVSDGEKRCTRQKSKYSMITKNSSKCHYNNKGKENSSKTCDDLNICSNSYQIPKTNYLKESSIANVAETKCDGSNVETHTKTFRTTSENHLSDILSNDKSCKIDTPFSSDCNKTSESLDNYSVPEKVRTRRSTKPKTIKQNNQILEKCSQKESETVSSDPEKLQFLRILPEDMLKDDGDSENMISDLQLEDIDALLEKAYSLIAHHPPSSLYSEICLLLALIKGCKHTDTAYLLSEANAITLRHQTLTCLGKKIRKKESETSSNTILPKSFKETTTETWRKYHADTKFRKVETSDRADVMNTTLQILPEEWTICQIACVPSSVDFSSKNFNRSLIMGRFQKNKDPLLALVLNPTHVQTLPKTLSDELQNIKFENKESVKNRDKKLWWETRRDLDRRLKQVTADMENIWLNCWKSFLVGDFPAADRSDIEEMLETIQTEFPNNLFDLQILKVLAMSLVWLNDVQLYSGIAQATGLGAKNASVKRICRIMRKTINTFCDPPSRNEVILILDKDVQCFPWECMPVLQSQPVSRMPSLKLIHGLTEFTFNNSFSVYNQGIDYHKTFFVLNPSSDLQRTQDTFEDWFKRQLWAGITARPPTSDEFTTGLTEHDLFLYVGHGSGTKYLSGDHIQYLDCRAVVLLMGCSSGRLHSYGKNLEACGTVLQYLLGGCPAVVANLWDVTDRDIDRYTKELLERWLPGDRLKENNLANAVSDSRQMCHLPYLIGAAPVLYGLPLHFRFR